MQSRPDLEQEILLNWLDSVLGPCEIVSDDSREHAGQRAAAIRLRTPAGGCYLKHHRDRSHWESEVHAYERWAPAFGEYAPRLIAVHAEQPLALVIGELPGRVLEEARLDISQERRVWRSTGAALSALHNFAVGEAFGPCRRDGTSAGKPIPDAMEYFSNELDDLLERGQRGAFLSAGEQAVVRSVRELVPAFAGERPYPCHRDYCPANWLVSQQGAWTGVIDFEFAYWDVWAADFSRNPDFDWYLRPGLLEAFCEGYGRSFSAREEQQLLAAHALYALGAIVWGEENAYHGFAGDGRKALERIGELLE